jgi:hypothetical protein
MLPPDCLVGRRAVPERRPAAEGLPSGEYPAIIFLPFLRGLVFNAGNSAAETSDAVIVICAF